MHITALPDHVPLPITISIYRIAEKWLSNAFHHAGGRGQWLAASGDGASITIVIRDEGPGISLEKQDVAAKKLGLRGLRRRVKSIGWRFDLTSVERQGTELRVWIPCPVQTNRA